VINLRPSNGGRWIPCPASATLESPFPDDESEYAKEGTAAHWLAAQVLSGHHTLDELTDRAAPNGVMITGEMVEYTEQYIAAVPSSCVIERPLPSAIEGVDDCTPDAFQVIERHGDIYDFKYGWGIVDVLGNWQLGIYAVSLFAKHQWNLDTVTVRIVQPRPYHYDGRVRSWAITRDDAIALWHEITAAVAKVHEPNAPAVTGAHCQYCRALHVCEAARRAGMNAVDVAYSGFPVDMEGAALASELVTLNRAARAIKLRLDAIESHAILEIDQNKIVPGWSLERAYGRRRWLSDDKVNALAAIAGKSLTEHKPVTPAAAEKLGVPRVLIDQFTTTPETGRKLVQRDASQKAKDVFQ